VRPNHRQTAVQALALAFSLTLLLNGCGGGDAPGVPKGAGADLASEGAKAKVDEGPTGKKGKGGRAPLRPMNKMDTAE
jgi:hypothetical protein